jgi:GntR family transcriptional repressor for pyruvate dehydrogenase complex
MDKVDEIPTESGAKRKSAADRVFQAIQTWILTHRFQPGDCLPSQDDLARRFSVSRNTVREALTRLDALGLITARQGVGTIVIECPRRARLDFNFQDLALQPAEVSDFLEARLFVERSTVHLAVMRANSAELNRLRRIVQDQKKALEKRDIDRFSQLDVEFHTTLAAVGGNRALNIFFSAVWEKLHRFIGEVSRMSGIVEESCRAHESIVAQMEVRNAMGAKRCLTEHLYRTGQGIERNTGVKLGLEAFVEFMQNPSSSF